MLWRLNASPESLQALQILAFKSDECGELKIERSIDSWLNVAFLRQTFYISLNRSANFPFAVKNFTLKFRAFEHDIYYLFLVIY